MYGAHFFFTLILNGAEQIRAGVKKFIRYCLWLWIGLAGMQGGFADVPPRAGDVPAIIQRNYDTARRRYAAAPDDNEAAWQFAHACYDRAEFPKDDKERAALANEGIEATRKLIARAPNSAPGHYYLAMNLAELARTKLLGALPLVSEMEKEWLVALSLDEKFDYAGPDRYLGLLYRDAPGRPFSVGSTDKARKHLLRAVEVNPAFPENRLNLIETWLTWQQQAAAASEFKRLQEILPAAHKEFSSEYWDASWRDWNNRIKDIRESLAKSPSSTTPRRR